MDYTKFMDDNFDAKEWVNTAFRNQKESGVSKDQHATTMVMKLQVFIQEVNNVLEEAGQQALQNLPRVVRELDAIKQEASMLQDQMRVVKQDIQKVEQDTSQSMQSLVKLDKIKSRMKTTADALKEADNWSTLSADMEEVFQSQNVQDITAKLTGMQQSLLMLEDTPDYAEKCQHLEQLKNRLEAMLSPQLIAAFNAQSLEQTQQYCRVFESIHRLPQLHKYYHKCHKNTLLQTWKSNWEAEPGQGALSDLYDLLLSTWHGQVKWCSQVFAEPVPLVLDLLTQTLNTLDPSLPSTFAVLVGEREGSVLDTLIDLKEISDRCAHSLESAVDRCSPDLCHRRSLEELLKALYSPYLAYTGRYRQLEEAALTQWLDGIKLDHIEVMDTVQLLAESVNKLFAAANQAGDRCQKLTNGFCYMGLMAAYKTYFTAYTREFRRVLVNIREKCRVGSQSDVGDWSVFQNALRIIQTCGQLLMQTETLDSQTASAMLHCLSPLLAPGHSPAKDTRTLSSSVLSQFQFQASLFLTSLADINNLESLLHKLAEGESPPVFAEITSDLSKLSSEVHKFAFEIVFSQLKTYLGGVANMEIWTSQSAGGAMTSDLPTFSLSPQEYITKVGQYLMTLPQHLDPFTLQESPALITALKHGRLPYTNHQELPEHLADLWLESVAMGTMHTYTEEILRIPQATPHGCKQLMTDIDYLCNVLEDLGLKASETLTHIHTLLQVKPEDFADTAELLPQRVSHTIGTLRGVHM